MTTFYTHRFTFTVAETGKRVSISVDTPKEALTDNQMDALSASLEALNGRLLKDDKTGYYTFLWERGVTGFPLQEMGGA